MHNGPAGRDPAGGGRDLCVTGFARQVGELGQAEVQTDLG